MPTLNEVKPKPKTRVALIVDKSGSMAHLSKFVVDTYNEQLAKLRENAEDQEITMTLVFFDSKVEVKCFNVPLSEVKDLAYEEYRTGTMTALNDAIGLTIDQFKGLEDFQDENVSHLCVVITDGYENDSKEYHQKTVANNIKMLQEDGWTFTYLGANVDVKKVAQDYNLHQGNTMSYSADASGVKYSSRMTSKGIGSYLGARTRGVRSVSSFYDNATNIGGILENDENLTENEKDATFDIHMGNADLNKNAVPLKVETNSK